MPDKKSWILAALIAPLFAAFGTPLGTGPYSTLQMTLARTIFHVDAVHVAVRVDRETTAHLEELAHGQAYSDPLAERIADAVLHSIRTRIQMRFLRDVDFDEFISETKKAESCAFESGIVNAPERDRVDDNLIGWYAPLKDRGLKKGDTLLYDVNQSSTKTIYQTNDGRVLVFKLENGPGPRSSVLGGYFAPCSQFREDLIRSLFHG